MYVTLVVVKKCLMKPVMVCVVELAILVNHVIICTYVYKYDDSGQWSINDDHAPTLARWL